MTASFLEVRHSRPDEWLNELALNVSDGSLTDSIVRMAVVREGATQGDLIPTLKGFPDGNKPLHPSIEARWLQAGYVARGQMMRLSAFVGLHHDGTSPVPNPEKWATRNRETSERELELVRQLTAGITAHEGLEIRTGGLHGEDPGWRAHEDIAAPGDVAVLCITCITPIRFSNEQWRHESDGRAEAYIEAPCPKCNGSRVIAGRRGDERCRYCETTPGVQKTLNHLADNAIENRKV